MLKRFILSIVLLAASCTAALAAYPYDSVAEILVDVGQQYAGGSASLIATTEDQALLLTCQHVVQRVGNTVLINWVATGEEVEGKVVAIGKNGLDVALVVCPRPADLRAIPVSSFKPCKDEQIINIGFPGLQEVLEWQVGTVTSLDETDLRYTCRPITGMSGGATLDVYGNLVGVIQYYNPDGGGSTSGVDMLVFLRDYVRSAAVKWAADMPEKVKKLGTPTDVPEVGAPESYREFLIYLYQEYQDGPIREFLEYTTPGEDKPDTVK